MMGRERAVLRWDVHRRMVLDELRRLEQSLAGPGTVDASTAASRRARIEDLRARLQELGPSPQAKMG